MKVPVAALVIDAVPSEPLLTIAKVRVSPSGSEPCSSPEKVTSPATFILRSSARGALFTAAMLMVTVAGLEIPLLSCAVKVNESVPVTVWFSLVEMLPLSATGGFAVDWPVYQSLDDEWVARKQFPVLADFETPFEQTRFSDVHQVQREQNIVRHGRYALRVQLSTVHYSGISLFYFPHDWRESSLFVSEPASWIPVPDNSTGW